MRFLPDGLSIPDELLVARDEGRAIFFCGAGVSRARAGLSDFFGLAHKVVDGLGVTADSPIKKVMEQARELESKTGVVGLISADRLFGLLERDFSIRDIHAAVATALKPASPTDLSAHRVMLDLARGPDGKVRLVTTNFDLLFECCDSTLPYSQLPHLPDPQHHDAFEGIIHLHGRVDRDYRGADGDGFVLSSAEFGRAYLSEGWATRFIRAILERYFVVFVGYTADDPPVQYLLEALNRSVSSRPELYAFQSGAQTDAEARWLHKGVQPIAYKEGDNHKTLWDTLAAWAVRARDPEAWYEDAIARARLGPEALLPHERGQIAHVVSTLDGMKKFVLSPESPPANWMCVFDPSVRYSRPGYLWTGDTRGPYFDPFRAYGLDSDPVPTPIEPDDHYVKREIPSGVWDGLAATRLDLQSLSADGSAGFRGHWATHVPRLPARLAYLGAWLSKASHQPASVWWAAGQVGIHPDMWHRIRLELERTPAATASPDIRRAWRYLFEAWERQENDPDSDLYALTTIVDREGWTTAAVRRLALILRPHLTASRPAMGRSRPPDPGDHVRVRDVADLDVKYPTLHRELILPDEYVRAGVRELRKNLEHAVSLETEVCGYGLHGLCPIERDPDLEGDSSARGHGISGAVLQYVSVFTRLAALNVDDARQEYMAWRVDEDEIFARLRIWACGNPRILSGVEAGQLICGLNDRVFWNSYHQRDLLLVLRKRWADFPPSATAQLERRLLDGPPKWENEDDAEHAKRAASSSLSRIHWLDAHGCRFTYDISAESAALRQRVPDWQPQYAKGAAASMEPRGGWVRRDTQYSALLGVPLSAVLDEAEKMSGRADELLLEKRPFAGLASQRPARALGALRLAAKRNAYPAWAWRSFLETDARKQDKPRLTAVITARLAQLPATTIAELIHPIANYMLLASPVLFAKLPLQFERLWAKVLAVLECNPDVGKSAIVRGAGELDWSSEALNSPVGKLAQVIMNDPQSKGFETRKGGSLPWIRWVDQLLSLDGDLRRHALVMLAHNLNWFFAIDPNWTEKNLISVLDVEGPDQDAGWAGFLWGAQMPTQANYLVLKPRLLRLAKRHKSRRHTQDEVLAGMLLAGWGSMDEITGEQCVSDAEMREVLVAAADDFRSHTLWQLERWASDDSDVCEGWRGKVTTFLANVWPKHKKAKSPRTTAALCNLAFSSESAFPEVVDIIVPLVIQSGEEHLSLYGLDEAKGGIVDKYPEKMLALLFAVLPEAVAVWPYGIDDILEQTGLADPSLLKDPRLVELKRRWSGR